MRYFRFTIAPGSPEIVNGAVVLRMHFPPVPEKPSDDMLYLTLSDGMWLAVDDSEMGMWGGMADYILASDLETLYWQEGVPQGNPATVVEWTTLLRPYDDSPQAAPDPGPPIVITPPPG